MLTLKRGREITRLEALSDAIFGFSATLLVVSLEVPRTLPELQADLRGFVAFGLSFAALILIWSVHNGFFRRYGLQDGWTIFWNSCLLFVVLFYVYPLKFISVGFARSVLGVAGAQEIVIGPNELGTLFMLYGLGFVAVFLCVALLYRHAWRRRAVLALHPHEEAEARFWFRHYLLFVAVGIISVGVAKLGLGVRMGLPGWIYALIGPLCAIHARRTAHAHRPPTLPVD